jgi:adenosylcobinamide-GDP ribazoletransferase
MSGRDLLRALGLFSIVPVPATPALTRPDAERTVAWLPVIGLGLGALAGLPVAAIRATAAPAGLVAAIVGVAALAVLTRGLHLDGLADTADGLGSRATEERALEIMRRSDIGPFGVVTLVLVLGLDVGAVAVPPGTWTPVAALATAAATGRLAVVHGAHQRVGAAQPGGFGALVAGSVSTMTAAIQTVAVLGAGALLALAVDADPSGWVGAQVVALLLAAALRVHTTHRFGGVTGDVFGALIECATAVTLVGIALT